MTVPPLLQLRKLLRQRLAVLAVAVLVVLARQDKLAAFWAVLVALAVLAAVAALVAAVLVAAVVLVAH